MTTEQLKQIGLRTAIYSFLIGSVIFLAYILTSYDKIIYLEYIFIFISLSFSLIILLRLFKQASKNKRKRRSFYFVLGSILLSLFISAFYFIFMTRLMDTLRINLVNNTQTELRNIRLTGCKKVRLASIAPGADKTVWIHIERDCAIQVSYTEKGVVKNEMVTNFVSTSMGKKIKYVLGGDSNQVN
jgi:amino acid transporter